MQALFKRAKWDAERSRELDAYIDIETDENVARARTELPALSEE